MVPEIVDVSLLALIRRKIGWDASQCFCSFDDVDFLGEPWMYLYAMVHKKPARTQFIGEMGEPGPWTVGFTNALAVHYGAVASRNDLARLATHFNQIATAYFAWKALGGTDSEARRTMKNLELIINDARKLIDLWDTLQVAASFGKQKGEEFAIIQMSSRITLSKRAAASLGTVLRKKPGLSEPTEKTAVGQAKFQQFQQVIQSEESAPETTLVNITSPNSKRPRPGKRQREESKRALSAANDITDAVPGAGLSVTDTSPNPKTPARKATTTNADGTPIRTVTLANESATTGTVGASKPTGRGTARGRGLGRGLGRGRVRGRGRGRP